MAWYVVLLPAVATALLIRLDSVLIGPYWTFMDVVPGMGGTDVDWWYERPTLRWAFVRRYAYLIGLGVGLELYDDSLTTLDVVLVGGITAGLLLWPIIFHGLPLGVAKSDWQLIPLYPAVVASFMAAAATGSLGVDYVREQSGGDALGWLKDQAFQALFWPLLMLLATSLFVGSYKSLRQRKHRRDKEGYE